MNKLSKILYPRISQLVFANENSALLRNYQLLFSGDCR